MKEKIPQILTVLGLLMYPIARAIVSKMDTTASDPTWILYTGIALTGVFILSAFGLQFKKMLEKRSAVQNKGNQ